MVWGTKNISDNRAYEIPLAIQITIPVVLTLLTLFIHESPTWLALRGRMDDARKVLMTFRNQNTAVVESEISSLEDLVRQAENRKEIHFWEIINKANIKRTLISGAFGSLSQVCGQILTLAYATVVLVQSGVQNPFLITIIIYLAQFVGVCIGITLTDKVGRRPVALFGLTIIFCLDVAIGGVACGPLSTNPQRIALAALFIIFAFFNSLTFQSLLVTPPLKTGSFGSSNNPTECY